MGNLGHKYQERPQQTVMTKICPIGGSFSVGDAASLTADGGYSV